MERIKWWLVLSLISQLTAQDGLRDATQYMRTVSCILKEGNHKKSFEAIKNLKRVLEDTQISESTSMTVNQLVAFLHKPKGPFKGIRIIANDKKARADESFTNCKVSVQLPRELAVGSDNTVVFCMLTLPDRIIPEEELFENRLVGLSVRGRTVSGLKERVIITINFTMGIHETRRPKCVFLNFSTEGYSHDGCETLWERNQSYITCSCDHLTYFGVLMVDVPLSRTDQEILSYITVIGCSLSLFALVLTVLLFVTKKKLRADVSMKVHINLAVALIFLNVHFLIGQARIALSTTELCFYVAMLLHYSLLATFSWMALEGFHLYLLLVRVFNIYFRRYLLKLSVIGWGIPAVIVFLVVIIDKNTYGPTSLESQNENSTTICYITNETVKTVTTVGVFGLVFVFNVIILGVTVRRVLSSRQRKEFEPDRAMRDICTLLGLSTLLGITWSLVFFSLVFGSLTSALLYPFSILNSLQGFFIFLWFVMSIRKTGKAAAQTGNETRNTNS